MQGREEDPRDRLLDNVSPAELRHSNFELFDSEDADSHTGMERWMRREGHRQARLVCGEEGPDEEGPDFQWVANGGVSGTSTGVSEGSGPEDLSQIHSLLIWRLRLHE